MIDTIYYTPEEISKRFRLSLSTIYNLIEKGDIPNVRIGKCYRIPHNELVKYLDQRRHIATPKGPPPSVKKFVELVKASPIRENILDIVLFGSYARGDFNGDSDIDVLVILKDRDNESSDSIAALCDDAMEYTDYDDLLSVVHLSKEQWEEATRLRTPFYNAVAGEGISQWKT